MNPGPGKSLSSWLPRVALCCAVVLSVYAPFSHWAINAEGLGKRDMGLALLFALSFPVAVYASLGIALLSLLMGAVCKASRRQGGGVWLLACLAGLLPLVFLTWLDFA